jgi:hypothetical protein
MVSSSAPLQLSPPDSPIICSSSATTRPMSSCLPCAIACVMSAVAFSYLLAQLVIVAKVTTEGTHVQTQSVGRDGSWGKGDSAS